LVEWEVLQRGGGTYQSDHGAQVQFGDQVSEGNPQDVREPEYPEKTLKFQYSIIQHWLSAVTGCISPLTEVIILD
jgi:hypothetical protein